MAEILVGLYRTLTEAEGVVHELVEQGFARPHIMLATPHATVSQPEDAGIRTYSTLEGEQGLKSMLLDLGVPESEASAYVEAVRQGDALVTVQASAEQVEAALDMLHRQRPGNPHADHTRWQYVDKVGVVSHSDPALHTVPGTADTASVARFAADFREHHRTRATESGLTYMEYEPAYRYGYDVGQRYPDKDWRSMEAGIRQGWEMWHPGTWERFKDAIRYGWDTVHAPL
jgi:hypothetical protein